MPMSQSAAVTSRHGRSPLPLGCAPVDAVNQHRQLRRVQHQRPTRIDVRRPKEYAVFEPLGEQAEAGAVPEYDLDEIGLPTPEQEEVARERILPQHALHQHSKSIDALAHVDKAEGEVNLHAPRKQRHDACSSVGGITSVISTATNSGAACVSSSFQRNRTRAAIP